MMNCIRCKDSNAENLLFYIFLRQHATKMIGMPICDRCSPYTSIHYTVVPINGLDAFYPQIFKHPVLWTQETCI